MATCAHLAETIDKDRTQLRQLVRRVVVSTSAIRTELDCPTLAVRLGFDSAEMASITHVSQVRLTRTGLAIRLLHSNGRPALSSPADPGLVQLLLRARAWWARLATGEIDIATIAREEKVNDSWISRVVRLNFLAPAIIEAIVSGTQPTSINAASLRSADIPARWNDQLAHFGM
jgi:hypothetical protein